MWSLPSAPARDVAAAANVPWCRPARFAAAANLSKPHIADATCCGIRPRERDVTTADLGEGLNKPLDEISCDAQVEHLQHQNTIGARKKAHHVQTKSDTTLN